MTDWITADAAAERLGVKRATLYAYVSRGVLVRKRAADGRGSLFDAAEIDRLTSRGRPRHPAGGGDLIIESAITEITGEHLRYRGHDVTTLARTRTFEDVATLLWTGELPAPLPTPPGWRATAEAVAIGSAAQAALPARTLPAERLQVIVPALAAADPLRLHLDPPAVIAAAHALIGGLTDCLPAPGEDPPEDSSIAVRLWRKLCPQPPSAGLLDALRAALVLLADHELAASTLAARVAASVRADPYAVVATGLGALAGPLHGGASLGVEGMLAAAAEPADAPRVVAELLRRTGRVPGFGHLVYKSGDPRALCLLGLLRRGVPASGPAPARLAVAEGVLAEMRRRSLPEPNVDFALALLKEMAGMISGAGEAIFAIARSAGWTAHALEEYARATPLRPRAVYVGPPGIDAASPDLS
ncbi:MAG TPA: citrate/2-methylcitrate synthase [Streptosporangiaceae bacterium]|jgi:citrate synthase